MKPDMQEITFGNYPQGKNAEVLPIEWIILEKEENKALIISKYSLSIMRYNENLEDITWENCSLRKWLNDTFLQEAFTMKDMKSILETKISPNTYPLNNANAGNETIDRVFLLSIDEMEKYFISIDDMKCAPTEFTAVLMALSSGKYNNDEYEKQTCTYWLRSSGFSQYNAAFVFPSGVICYAGNISTVKNCIRPAMWIDISNM